MSVTAEQGGSLMTQGPDPRAALRGFMALVLDMVRVDPDRRPSAEMQRWHRELAATARVIGPGRHRIEGPAS